MVFNFTFTFAPRVFGALCLQAGTQSHAQTSAVNEEASVNEESTSISSLSPSAYYTDEEEENSSSTPDALLRLHRRSKSPRPLNATMRRKAKKTDADLSSLSDDGGRPRKRARKAELCVPDPDPNFQLYPTNGLYGEQELTTTDVAGAPYWSSSPSRPSLPQQQWLPPTPPLDHGATSFGTYVGGEIRKNKRKRSPGKGSASVYHATLKTSSPYLNDVSHSSNPSVHTRTTPGVVVTSPPSNPPTSSSLVLPPSPATTSSPPTTSTNDFTGKKYFIEAASQENGNLAWICFINPDGSVHTRCRSDSPMCSLLEFLVNAWGLRIDEVQMPGNSSTAGSPKSSSGALHDSPTTDHGAYGPTASIVDYSTSPSTPEITWGPPIVVSDTSYTLPTTTEGPSAVPVVVAGPAEQRAESTSLEAANVETDINIGQGQYHGNLTTDNEHITAPVSSTLVAAPSSTAPATSAGSADEHVHLFVSQSEAEETTLAATDLLASTSTPPLPVAGVVYSHVHYRDTQLVAVNAWYKHESTVIPSRIQLHSSTSEQNTLWLRVLSYDGSHLMDSVTVQKHAVIRDDEDGYVSFLVMVLKEGGEWQPRFFAIKRGPEADAVAGYFNAAIPPATLVEGADASSVHHVNTADDVATEAPALQASQPGAGNQVSTNSPPAIEVAMAVASSDVEESSTLTNTDVHGATFAVEHDASTTWMDTDEDMNGNDASPILAGSEMPAAPDSYIQPTALSADTEMTNGALTLSDVPAEETSIGEVETGPFALEEDEAMSEVEVGGELMHLETAGDLIIEENSVMTAPVTSPTDVTELAEALSAMTLEPLVALSVDIGTSTMDQDEAMVEANGGAQNAYTGGVEGTADLEDSTMEDFEAAPVNAMDLSESTNMAIDATGVDIAVDGSAMDLTTSTPGGDGISFGGV
ncbi:hypothetical protein FRB97_000630 [Tulasnella sp. 331]|nr:hypothetical protein FRB97_000630 [Tulasnella sp. 331]